MQSPESVNRLEELGAPATTVFVAEIACILCNRAVGMAIDTRWPPVNTV
jgi:hypothetical protein